MAGETVLTVDDRQDSLKFLREYVLEPNGYKIVWARNGVEALKIIQSQTIDLIISDLVMPKMGGLELLESLREKGLDIPTILMTFHGSEGTAVKAFRLGARDYIIKPFVVDEMLDAIDRALSESRLRQERDSLTKTVLHVNQQLESRVQELRFLYGIGRSVTSLKDLEQILNRIVEAAVYLTKAEEGSLMLVDSTSGELYLRAVRGMGERNARNFRLKIDDSIAGQVVRTGRPMMIGGMNQNDSFKVTTDYFVKALLNVPLKDVDRVIGVLAVNQKSTVRAFTDRHLNLLIALADYASIAIQNARLYTQLTSDVDRAEQSSRELKQMVRTRTEELKVISQQLLKTEDLASLGYMATGVAKEMASPIDNILNALDQLKNQVVESTDRPVELLSLLEREALHCRELVQSLLNFSRQSRYQPQEADLNGVIEAAWRKYRDECHLDDSIEFVRDFAFHLPQLFLDTNQMELALFYLIRHACQSMPSGGTLHITTQDVASQVQVVISDTGKSIPPEDLSKIFEPFYKYNHHAYGLDLAITYAVIQRHRGTIEVDSMPGQGTTFTIYLPK